MSKHHMKMAVLGGANLMYFSTYRNGLYPNTVIRHFRTADTQFLLIEKSKKVVDLLTIKTTSILHGTKAAECIFEA